MSQQARTVEELTASLKQVSEQTRLNAKNVKQASDFFQTAKANVSEGNVQMKNMLQAMDELNLSSANINKVIAAAASEELSVQAAQLKKHISVFKR